MEELEKENLQIVLYKDQNMVQLESSMIDMVVGDKASLPKSSMASQNLRP